MAANAHGEYKLPGGKLVAVDFVVRDGRIFEPVVHGDFFLYPEDSLSAIAGALEGVPVDATQENIADRVSATIPAGTEWLGSSPEALAIAVRRALDGEATR